jgi:hypothetical protein
MNRAIGGVMAEALRLDHYPDAPGQHQIFLHTRGAPPEDSLKPRPEVVIVIGLGAEGSLRPADLVMSVRSGVLAWAQRVREEPLSGSTSSDRRAATRDAPSQMILAATLIGSGGILMSAGKCAILIVQGVCEANERLELDASWPRVERLELVELYLERAAEAWRALRGNEVLPIALDGEVDQRADGLLRPLDSGYRGVGYDFVSATTGTDLNDEGSIRFVVDTKRARGEETGKSTPRAQIEPLIAQAADESPNAFNIRNSLFTLIIPPELESHLLGSTELLIELDHGTAGIPWELLHPASSKGEGQPWAIRSKLLRRLRVDAFRRTVSDADQRHGALIIGEPLCDPTKYQRLPGARAEAAAVGKLLKRSRVFGCSEVTSLIATARHGSGPTCTTVTNAILDGPWRIIHIAGHGEAPDRPDASSSAPRADHKVSQRGVVLSGGVYFGPAAFEALRIVPELVFVNCCFLGEVSPEELLRSGRTRPEFAYSVAEGLIKLGVKCVVAAGWAVTDEYATRFASAFYGRLLRGDRFIDAVAAARLAIHRADDNTWAAYQAYGDPDWRLTETRERSSGPPISLDDLDTICTDVGLVNALETIAVHAKMSHPVMDAATETRRGTRSMPRNRPRADAGEADHSRTLVLCLRTLESRVPKAWQDQGHVAEAFGNAWAALGPDHRGAAIEWYERALKCTVGRASFRTAQELGQLAGREAFEAWRRRRDRGPDRRVDRGKGAKKWRSELSKWLEFLVRLAELRPTAERHELCGSTAKRLMLLLEGSGASEADRAKAETAMRSHYEEALRLARERGPGAVSYAGLMVIAATLHVMAREGARERIAHAAIEEVRTELSDERRPVTFWTKINSIELRVYEALSCGCLHQRHDKLLEDLVELREKYKAPWGWDSVRHQAEFVLAPWSAQKAFPAKERQAAQELLERVRKYAPAMGR